MLADITISSDSGVWITGPFVLMLMLAGAVGLGYRLRGWFDEQKSPNQRES